MLDHARTRIQMASFKGLTKATAMQMPASDRATHCAGYANMNDQMISMLKDCSPEMANALDLAELMCSGTSEYNRLR